MPRVPILLLSVLLAALVGCGAGDEPQPVAVHGTATPGEAPSVGEGMVALLLGDPAGYPDPGEMASWPQQPLDDARYALVSSELACASRSHHGDPGAQRSVSRRVLSHHRTSAQAMMDYGIAVNVDPKRALVLGAVITGAATRCD